MGQVVSAAHDRAEAAVRRRRHYRPEDPVTEDYCEKWDMPASIPGWEEWRPIPSFPSYSASSLGRIYSRPREHTKGGVLKTRISRRKYREVRLHRADGYSRTCRVHALVCEAFYGMAPERQGARHLDGDSLNNLATNLCWGTQAENLEDARRHGTMPPRRINGHL
jgi:hypothetical protein